MKKTVLLNELKLILIKMLVLYTEQDFTNNIIDSENLSV